MSLLGELERRNVVRVAVGYLAGAWLLIQIADTVLPRLGAPDAAVTVLIVILAIGFVPAIVLSWLFEWTPTGWKHDRDVTRAEAQPARQRLNTLVIVTLVLATGFFALDKFLLDPARDAVREEAVAQQARSEAIIGAYGERSIAVLPFANMSADPEQEYFADGIAEELLNLLAKIPELRVISRTTAFTFKGQDLPVPEVAKKLNVSHVLEGSVRRSGNRVRITVQLIEAHSDTHLWSEIYDRELADVFEVQNEISQRVVADLRLTLLGEIPRARVVDPQAYVLFLRARELLMRTTDGSRSLEAIGLLEEALAIEPEWPDALFQVARANFRLTLSYPDREEYRRELRRLVALMDEIEPGGVTATTWHAWLAFVWDNDLQKAADHFERAVAMDPRHPELLRPLVTFVLRLRRYDLAGPLSAYIVSRDPACVVCVIRMAQVQLYTGRRLAAAKTFESLLEWHTPDDVLYWRIGVAWLVSGDPERALHFFEQQEVPESENLGRLLALHDLGRTAEFDAGFALFRETAEPESIARIYAWTGDADQAFHWLGEAVREEGPAVAGLVRTDLYEKLHADPRWEPFLAENGAADEDLSGIRFDPVFPPDVLALDVTAEDPH